MRRAARLDRERELLNEHDAWFQHQEAQFNNHAIKF